MIWGRAMTAPAADAYSHGAHIAKVRKAGREAGLKGAVSNVLAYLCDAADYGKPTVRVSKATICARTAYHWDTVRLALRHLRQVGFIDPVAFATGGRHKATVYVLKTGKGAENPPPLRTHEPDKGGGFSGQKGAENPVKRGRKIHPPSKVLSYDPSRSGERTALVGQGGERQADKAGSAMTERARVELQTFAQDVTRHGYSQARALQSQRAAQADGKEGP